jgi:hypothetical protein
MAVLAVAVLVALPAAAAKRHKLLEEWLNPDHARHPLRKLVVLAIVDDEPARKQFENKFVSHLRGRGVEAAVSYAVAPDLSALPSREQVEAFLHDESIDGAVSVRVVALHGTTESDWAAAWSAEVRGTGTLAELVRESLPIASVKSPSYGIEVTLWDADKRTRIWSGRTNPYTRKEMRSGAAEFVQFVLDALEISRLL